MCTCSREVCLEIYLNGVYHGTETFQVPAEDEDQVECRIIPDAICDLFGSSAVIDSLERIDSPEDMPVSSSVVEGGAVQVDSVNDSTASASVVERDGLEDEVKNVSSVLVSPTELAGSGTDASPETPENSPTESTKVWMMKKASGFFQMLFGVPEPLCVPDTHQPTSATDLVDSEQETPVDLDNLEQPDVPVPIVSEQETPVDLVDLEESSVSALNRSEAEPVSTEGLEVEVKDAISDLKSPTLVCEDLSDSAGPSGRTSGIDQSGMDASPETPVKISPKESTKVRKKGKIRAFFKKLFRIDPAVPETLCLPDASVPEMDPESELSDAYESSDEGPSVAEMVSEWDLSDSYESSDEGPSVAEMVPEWDLSDSYESSDEGPSVAEMVPEWDLSDSYESSDEGPSVAEMDPEWDLSDAYESCDEGPSVPEMDPESDLSDAYETCDEGPSVPEMDPESDLSDSDESCVQGPSSPCACTSKQELVQEGPDSRFAERVKGCTKDLEPVTEVWNNIFIGNEVIAEDRMKLKELGITHILNAAALKNNLRVLMGVPCEEDLMETVDTGASYYRGMNITYCRMPTTQTSNISKYFVPAAKFIHKAMKNPQNKVLIHCAKGVSHAPTLFLAYLMIHHDMTGDEAIDYLIQVRYIKPDLDFLKKLTILDQLLCTMRLVHKTTSYRRENDKTWLKKLEAKILQKKCCCTPDKECGRIERRFTLFRAFHLRSA
ncbi:dual specificity protein phosphatase [Pimephales promelas]|nr:dual specificity protein phosphatase [Pimephales promelas]